MKRHPFHLVELSPWPILAGFLALMLTSSLVLWFHTSTHNFLILALTGIIMTMYVWWRDISREGTMMGFHTNMVVYGLRVGMILFITSEILFFFGFFWGYFHSSLVPTNELGCMWPPIGVSSINAFSIPMLNTVILLSSGVTVTLSHHSIIKSNYFLASISLIFTIILGLYFTYMQAGEYYMAPFNISDSVYGTTFFVTTGFHGAHVVIGSLFLLVCFMRLLMKQFSSSHHFGFEAAAWYWHFVDVVWICLFISMYWWGS
uniref:Cytochrome c oxidase subunit 3 n=1 Tax=Codonobdella sp. IK-2021 TaxID=2848640 RepID=A0A8F2E636_9ANNE|nr:cytochrome c oxidase subunit III [Codonobdella sp. B45A]QWT29630.1 cytochrome c oxidase subunit 3 [Codonobdella sp. IK-2021]UTS56339.1 cytochrome c oxidase subunit 3 [Codonobdella sp. B45A]